MSQAQVDHEEWVLRVAGLKVQFRGSPPQRRVLVLGGLDAVFYRGQICAVVGPSGSGKTTLLNVIAGLLAPTEGTVAWKTDKGRATTGYVFQDPHLLPWRTVEANALFGAEISGTLSHSSHLKCRHLFERYGISGFEQNYPRTLSGGMQQRVALIRAVLAGASVLLLDEPFSNSDFLTRRALQADLLDIVEQERVTAILVTHDLEEAIRLGDRVLVFSHRPARVLLDLSIEIPRYQRLNDLSAVVLEPYLSQILEAFTPESLDAGTRA